MRPSFSFSVHSTPPLLLPPLLLPPGTSSSRAFQTGFSLPRSESAQFLTCHVLSALALSSRSGEAQHSSSMTSSWIRRSKLRSLSWRTDRNRRLVVPRGPQKSTFVSFHPESEMIKSIFITITYIAILKDQHIVVVVAVIIAIIYSNICNIHPSSIIDHRASSIHHHHHHHHHYHYHHHHHHHHHHHLQNKLNTN